MASSDRDHLTNLAKTTTTNLYALLSPSLTPSSTPKEITRAYRTAALAVHPDKNPDDPQAAAKFHAITEAHVILTSDELRAVYDAANAVREAQRRAKEGYDARRREMLEELERRERGGRREEEKEVRERVLAEEGRRMRMELEARWRREREEREAEEKRGAADSMGRALRVRWDVAAVKRVDEVMLVDRFSKWGRIDGVTIRDGERKVRWRDEKHRRIVRTAVVVFDSMEEADRVVRGVQARKDKTEWRDWLVEWAEGKEPEGLVRSEKLSKDEMDAFLKEEEDVLARMVRYQREKEAKVNTS